MKKHLSALVCAVIASASVSAATLQFEALPSAGAAGEKVLAKPEVKLTGYGHDAGNGGGGGSRQGARSQEPSPSSTPEPESLALALLAIAALGGKRLRGSRNS